MGTPGQLLINLLPRNILDQLQQFLANDILSVIEWQSNLSNTTDESNNLNTEALFQVFLGDSTGSDSTNGFSCRSPSTSRGSFQTVLCQVSVVGMGWTGVEISLGVVVGSVVFVVNEKTDWCTEGNTVFSSRLDVDSVVLGSLPVSQAPRRFSKNIQRWSNHFVQVFAYSIVPEYLPRSIPIPTVSPGLGSWRLLTGGTPSMMHPTDLQ